MPKTNASSFAANNSTCTAPIYKWEWLHRYQLSRAKFSETSDLYQITIDGEQWDVSEHRRVHTRITDLYTEHHPYMAVGRAIIAYMEASAQSRIHDIRVYKRVERKSKKIIKTKKLIAL